MMAKFSEATLEDLLRETKDALQDALTQAEVDAADGESDGVYWDMVRDLEEAYDLIVGALRVIPKEDS
jgi:hypothetical protein